MLSQIFFYLIKIYLRLFAWIYFNSFFRILPLTRSQDPIPSHIKWFPWPKSRSTSTLFEVVLLCLYVRRLLFWNLNWLCSSDTRDKTSTALIWDDNIGQRFKTFFLLFKYKMSFPMYFRTLNTNSAIKLFYYVRFLQKVKLKDIKINVFWYICDFLLTK